MQKNFSHILSVDDISNSEKLYRINANNEELKQIAEILKVPEVKDFKAEIYTRHHNKSNLIDVWGRVSSLITRQSVISLEFFNQKYISEFSLQFDTRLTDNQVRELEEEGVENIPDVVIGGKIDLCQIAIEQIALELEDYPRKKGETFSFVSEFKDEDIKRENPFNVLAKLKK